MDFATADSLLNSGTGRSSANYRFQYLPSSAKAVRCVVDQWQRPARPLRENTNQVVKGVRVLFRVPACWDSLSLWQHTVALHPGLRCQSRRRHFFRAFDMAILLPAARGRSNFSGKQRKDRKNNKKNGEKCSECQCVRTPNDFVYLVPKRELASLQWLPWRLPTGGGRSS